MRVPVLGMPELCARQWEGAGSPRTAPLSMPPYLSLRCHGPRAPP